MLIIDDGSGRSGNMRSIRSERGPDILRQAAGHDRERGRRRGQARAETKTRFMSASSLRFVPDIIKLRDELPQYGPVHLASAAVAMNSCTTAFTRFR